MIGVFDSGLGGLTVLRELANRFPDRSFIYLGDHAHVPYGDRSSEDIINLTRDGVESLFNRDCRLVLLGCNTATAIAARRLQQEWLPQSKWNRCNILGIVAPTVEAATQTPWAVTSPQYPQKFNTDLIAIFGTTRTVASGVYTEEIRKRCPKVMVVQQVCSELAGAIERAESETYLEKLVGDAVTLMLGQTSGTPPHRAVLGCTHFPLVENLFRKHLPAFTRMLSQPEVVANSLEDYLARHQHYSTPVSERSVALLTTGDPKATSKNAAVFWPGIAPFSKI